MDPNIAAKKYPSPCQPRAVIGKCREWGNGELAEYLGNIQAPPLQAQILKN
jgi:hypothetical protein